jgi:hypothetical protein
VTGRLEATIDAKIHVRLAVNPARVQSRLPAPWTIAPASDDLHRGTNLLVIVSEVLLRHQPDGSPAPDAVNRHVALLAPAVHPDRGEAAVFMLRMYAAHPASGPGRFRNTLPARIWRERCEAGVGTRTVCADRVVVRPDPGGRIDLHLRYERGLPVRRSWPTTMRSAVDPSIVRRYQSEALLDVVWSAPAGIDRVEEYGFRAAVPECADLFDGSERLVSLTIVPWFARQEAG